MCRSAEVDLECRPECAAAGRHFVADTLQGWGAVDRDPASAVIGDVVLVAGELLANAVTARASEMSVAVEAHAQRIRISVRDDSSAPAVPRSPDVGDVGGRGLGLVATLSARWGQTAFDGRNKTVWAEIGIPSDSTLCRGCTA